MVHVFDLTFKLQTPALPTALVELAPLTVQSKPALWTVLVDSSSQAGSSDISRRAGSHVCIKVT